MGWVCRGRCHDRYFGGIGRVLVHDARLHGDVPSFHNVNSRTPHSGCLCVCQSLSTVHVSHWYQHVFDVVRPLILPLRGLRSSDILAWSLLVSHWHGDELDIRNQLIQGPTVSTDFSID
jgi:hypothetical protein